MTVRTERDCFGREIRKSVRSGGMEKGAYRYQWGIANRLLSKENELTGTVTRYDYDRFDFLIRQETMQGSETDVIYRTPDFVGNLFETPDKKDRKYGAGGKLLEDPDCFFHYDDEGNLIFREFKLLQETGVRFDRKRMEKERGIHFLATGTGWLYEWSSNGMLKKVIRPDGRPVEFRYDALGRRTAKQYFGKVTRWVWDGNVPIHEWSYKVIDMQSDEKENTPSKEPTEDITTWVFEADTFVPTAKIQDGKQYSIVSDYLGTPIQMYDEQGNKVWDCTLDIYGNIFIINQGSAFDCPFRWAGQYFDFEINLYYNRFRYYSSEIGSYLSQDPIGVFSDKLNYYSYVDDTNNNIDIIGLEGAYVFVIDKKKKIAYVGKGKWARFRKSVRHRTEEINGKRTKPTSWASKYYGNDEFAEMVEARVISRMKKEDYILVNKIASPGLKRYERADDATKKLVDKAANDLVADMKSNQGKDIKKEPHHH